MSTSSTIAHLNQVAPRLLRPMLLAVAGLLASALIALVTTTPALAAANPQSALSETVLVHFDAATTPETRDAVIAAMGGEMVTWMYQIHVAEVRLPLQAGISVAALPLMAEGAVIYAESDLVVEAAAVYNDPALQDEAMSYGLTQISGLEAWEVITGSPEIVVAVIDSGIKLDHPEFAGRLVAGYDFVNRDDQADDDMGHGTHVAGIIAATLGNGQGVAGVCPNCRLMPVKVLNQNNVGSWSQLAQGILFAVDNGARILNLSLGATVPSETLAAAIEYAQARGVVVVAAAGNQGSNAPYYPAALDGVIAVGATTRDSTRWARSNYGDYVDLVAPGELIFSTYNNLQNTYSGYTYMSGTSMAAPFVSGVVGLLLSARPDFTPRDVMASLVAGAVDLGTTGQDAEFGSGRVSATGTLRLPAVGLADQGGESGTPAQVNHLFLPALRND